MHCCIYSFKMVSLQVKAQFDVKKFPMSVQRIFKTKFSRDFLNMKPKPWIDKCLKTDLVERGRGDLGVTRKKLQF